MRECSQGRVQVPTGGKEQVSVQARERSLRRGQQIRCKSEADGDSPDGREQERRMVRPIRSERAFDLFALGFCQLE